MISLLIKSFFQFAKCRSPNPCNDEVFLLILVHSAPSNVQLRNVLRKTWTQNDGSLKRVFLIGHSVDSSTEKKVIEEINMHQDILVSTDRLQLLCTCVPETFEY